MAVPPAKNPPGRPPSTVGVRYTAQAEEILKQRASAAGMAVQDYVRKYYWELANEGLITPETEIKIQNPGPNPYQTSAPPLAPGGYPPQQPYGYPPQGYPPQQFNPYQPPYAQPKSYQMDSMFEEMKQLWMTKMLAEMIQGKQSIEQTMAAMQGKNGGGKDEFSMQDMMKYQMMMNMQDKQYQQSRDALYQQLEQAKAHGDKPGENQALQLITALATTQAQQSQNNMQQMMAMMQMANNTQQTMYTTSINASQQSQDRQSQERTGFQTQINQMQTNLNATQMESLKATSNLQLEGLKTQMESIRNIKDPLTQLIELDAMRKASPILDAAFKGAFGGGGGIGDMIPKLKELGIDKLIDKAGQALPAIVAGFMGGRGQQPLPPPDQQIITQIPGPLPEPTPEQLKALQETRLPPENQPTTQPSEPEQPQQNSDTVGYTNLRAMPPPEPINPPPPTQNPDTADYTNLTPAKSEITPTEQPEPPTRKPKQPPPQ